MHNRRVLRHRYFADPKAGEAFRDLHSSIAQLPFQELRAFDGVYTEPMRLAQLDSEPAAVLAVRVRGDAPETPIGHGTAAEWYWDGSAAVITHIAGLVVGLRYSITFLLTWWPHA